MKHLLLAASTLALLSACGQATDTSEVAASTQTVETDASVQITSAPVFEPFGVDLDNMDRTAVPGDDFNRYVNGAWMDAFEMPADKSRYGVFTILRDDSEQKVRAIIEELADEAPSPDTLEGKIAAVYNAYMDVEAINAKDLAPAQPYLDRIAAIETREDLALVFAATGFSSPISGWVDVDSKQTDQYIFYMTQSGLGLPDRSYYLEDSAKNVEIRAAYKAFVTTLLERAGYENPGEAAELVYSVEEEIAEAHWDRAIGRNRNLTYNKMTKEELIALGNGFPVELILDELGLGGETDFVVRQVTPTAEEIEDNGLTPEMVEKLGPGVKGLFAVANEAPIEAWKAYLTAHFLSDHASVLPSDIDDAVFDFYGRTLRGQPEQRERWKRAVSATEGALGEAVGKVYVERHFKQEAKDGMDELVGNLRKAMAQNLDNLAWMGEDTKDEARDKLAKFTPKIGYPEKFETYDTMVVDGDDAFGNRMAASEWSFQDMMSQLGQPIDRTQWFMTPQTVNAYYSPNRNEIVFPAAILQPPFFDLNADPAVNYGAIGGVIGHEIGHGFDDQGSKSDGNGVLRDWWTAEDREGFKARTDALVEQYNAFCPITDEDGSEVCVNGRLALGENIGDLAGLSMAYEAYKMSLNGEEAPVIDGFTGDQRFFMAWAQVWASAYRERALREHLMRGPHSPPEFRINGVVRNMDAWYEAFNVTQDHALYLPPEERVSIW